MSRQTREQLGVQPNDEIYVKGIVSFAKVDKLIEGADLDKENTRRQQRGMITADRPFRSISIQNPEVVQGQNTPLANFHSQSVYTSKDGVPTMSLESKSKFPPGYGHIQNGAIIEIPDPEKNPAQGQVVYLRIRAYKAKNFNNMGSTFDGIVFDEGDIKFYEGGGNNISGFGQALGLPVQSAPAVQPNNNTEVNSQGGAFGGNNQAQPQQGAFGQPQAQPDMNTQGAFGGQAQQQQGAFGQGQGQQQAQPDMNTQAGAFGGQAQSQQGAFGQTQPNANAQGGQAQPNPFGTQPNANAQGQPQQNPFDNQNAGNAGNANPFNTSENSPFA